MYALFKKIRNVALPIDLQLKLFDSLVSPILLYSCEIWGYENTKIIETIQLHFCKKILNVRSSTPNYMVYGELGRFPMEVEINLRLILFWHKLITGKNKLSGIVYSLMLQLQLSNRTELKWLSHIKTVLENTGFSNLWMHQYTCTFNRNYLKYILKRRLQDQFIQKWFQEISNSSRGETYSIFKTEWSLEPYLLKLNNTTKYIM